MLSLVDNKLLFLLKNDLMLIDSSVDRTMAQSILSFLPPNVQGVLVTVPKQ